MENKKQRWIIDTDPGVDDVMAILYLANQDNVEIEFISLAEGNCKMHDVVKNISKMFTMYGKEIPTFVGCRKQLVDESKNAYDYHYEDGMGNIDEIKQIDHSHIKVSDSPASVEIVKAVNKSPGEISILVLASLTNLTVSYMLDPSIKDKFKDIVVMGGSYKWRGNVLPAAEFNFCHDYIATNVFIKNFKNLFIVGWEPTEFLYYKLEYLEKSKQIAIEKFNGYNENLFKYVYLIIEKYTRKREGTQICDLYAIIGYFTPSSISKYFVSETDIIIDSTNKFNGGMIFKNTIYPEDPIEDVVKIFKSGKEYKQGSNIFIEDFKVDKIIEEFAYVLRPVHK